MARLEISATIFHPVGEAVWYEYEFPVPTMGGLWRDRGVALYRKSNGRWCVASMQHTAEHFEPGISAISRKSEWAHCCVVLT